jgi:hypothetical protein
MKHYASGKGIYQFEESKSKKGVVEIDEHHRRDERLSKL